MAGRQDEEEEGTFSITSSVWLNPQLTPRATTSVPGTPTVSTPDTFRGSH